MWLLPFPCVMSNLQRFCPARLSVCLQVHSEPVRVQEGSQRQHEELHIWRQQQRHDELTFHTDESYPAASRAPRSLSPPRLPHLCISLPPPSLGPDAWDSLPPSRHGERDRRRDSANNPPPSLLFDINIYKYTQIYFKATVLTRLVAPAEEGVRGSEGRRGVAVSHV